MESLCTKSDVCTCAHHCMMVLLATVVVAQHAWQVLRLGLVMGCATLRSPELQRQGCCHLGPNTGLYPIDLIISDTPVHGAVGDPVAAALPS